MGFLTAWMLIRSLSHVTGKLVDVLNDLRPCYANIINLHEYLKNHIQNFNVETYFLMPSSYLKYQQCGIMCT